MDVGDNITAILLALIAGVPAIIAAFYAYKASTKATTAAIAGQEASAHAATAASTTITTGHRIDGRMDELIALTRKSALNEGAATATAADPVAAMAAAQGLPAIGSGGVVSGQSARPDPVT